MKLTFYPEEDGLYFELNDEPFAYGQDLDDYRHINCSADREVIGIEFLWISDGVDLEGLPEDVKGIIAPVLATRNVRVRT
jgi:hypothetical protein